MNNVYFMLKEVRVHYPSFFEDRTFRKADNTVDYQSPGAKLLIDPSDPAHAELLKNMKTAIDGICAANNPNKGENGKGKRLPPDQLCLRDGSLTERDELQGLWFVSANGKKGQKIPVIDPFDPNKKIEHAHEQVKPIYNGCKINARVQLWYMKTAPGQQARVNAKLIAVQFAGDGEPIGAGIQTFEQAAQGFGVAIDPTKGGAWGENDETEAAVKSVEDAAVSATDGGEEW